MGRIRKLVASLKSILGTFFRVNETEDIEIKKELSLVGGVTSLTADNGGYKPQMITVDTSGHLQCDIAANSVILHNSGSLYAPDYGEITQLAGNAALDLSGIEAVCVTCAGYLDAGGAGRTVHLTYEDDAVVHDIGGKVTAAANDAVEVTGAKDISFHTTAGSTKNDLACSGGNAADTWDVAVRVAI